MDSAGHGGEKGRFCKKLQNLFLFRDMGRLQAAVAVLKIHGRFDNR